jgi:hypothetical protein
VGVAEGEDVPGGWDPGESGEPPAALLRRAISHVESLLHRLDPIELPDDDPLAHVSESAVTQLPIEPLEEPLPPSTSAAQADALRRSLRVHEEAHRLRAEASGVRAEAAAESERILHEARELSDRVRIEARDSVADLLGLARREAAVVIDAARSEAERIRQTAIADHEQRLAELEKVAERDRLVAADSIRELLDEATRDADRILERARDQGRAEATKLIDAEVASAVAAARRSVEDSHNRARNLLSVAYASVDDARTTMRALIDALRDSLAALDSSADSIASLLGGTAEPAITYDEPADESAPAEPMVELSTWTEHERRPLGLLFGASGA